MFKFNFANDEDVKDDVKDVVDTQNDEPLPCSGSDEVQPTAEQYEKFENIEPHYVNEMYFEGEHRVLFVPLDDVLNEVIQESKDINYAEQTHSDVVPGVYEGGAKVWECTQDLGLVLTKVAEEQTTAIIDELTGKTVLDLGCGSGILGILALNAGATVHFQDYNKTVLKHITIPNVILNVKNPQETIPARCKFYSGDWQNYIIKDADGPKFDQILTSETIYNPKNYQKILNVFKSKLKEDGVVYLAAKTLYFGVGGSLRQFEAAVKDYGTFQSKVIYVKKENVPREILEIKFLTKNDQ